MIKIAIFHEAFIVFFLIKISCNIFINMLFNYFNKKIIVIEILNSKIFIIFIVKLSLEISFDLNQSDTNNC